MGAVFSSGNQQGVKDDAIVEKALNSGYTLVEHGLPM
jgi:hypothetical protein